MCHSIRCRQFLYLFTFATPRSIQLSPSTQSCRTCCKVMAKFMQVLVVQVIQLSMSCINCLAQYKLICLGKLIMLGLSSLKMAPSSVYLDVTRPMLSSAMILAILVLQLQFLTILLKISMDQAFSFVLNYLKTSALLCCKHTFLIKHNKMAILGDFTSRFHGWEKIERQLKVGIGRKCKVEPSPDDYRQRREININKSDTQRYTKHL